MRRKRGDWFEFTVEGCGPFPIDMLRYDSCWPKSERYDSSNIAGAHDRGRRRVVLITADDAAPTPDRWESFGWRYVGAGELRNSEHRGAQ